MKSKKLRQIQCVSMNVLIVALLCVSKRKMGMTFYSSFGELKLRDDRRYYKRMIAPGIPSVM